MKDMRKYLVFSISFFLLFCSGKPGRFAFHTIDSSELNLIEKKWFRPRVFHSKKPPIIFYEDQILWYSYELNRPSYQKNYVTSLSQKKMIWSEIKLFNEKLELRKKSLVARLGQLNRGNYLIKVFIDENMLDQIQFEILPSRDNIVIDYDNIEDLESENIKDDILFYSSR